jgi:DNA-binding NtrC family response regulator
VRELENVVERAATLTSGPRITLKDLHIEFVAPALGGGTRPTLAALELDYIRRVVAEVAGRPPATLPGRPQSPARTPFSTIAPGAGFGIPLALTCAR